MRLGIMSYTYKHPFLTIILIFYTLKWIEDVKTRII